MIAFVDPLLRGSSLARTDILGVQTLRNALTSASFFAPHEETSGGDYAVARAGAVVIENGTSIVLRANDFEWVGGNGVVLSASCKNVTVTDSFGFFIAEKEITLEREIIPSGVPMPFLTQVALDRDLPDDEAIDIIVTPLEKLP